MSSSLPFGSSANLADRLAASGLGFDANGRDFDILNQALRATGLDAALADPAADLTLLAPTDAAFVALARSLGYQGQDEQGAFDAIVAGLTALSPGGDPLPLLTQILGYHVLPGSLTRREIAASAELPTLLADAPLAPFGRTLPDADPDAPDARFVAGRQDIAASNGFIQPIDQVRLPVDVPGNAAVAPPPTIAGLVAASGSGFDDNPQDFDVLLQAVQAAGLTSALADPTANLTVFAPTDGAFLELARTLGYDGTSEGGAFNAIVQALTDLSPNGDPVPLLADILTYHVVPGRLSAAQADAAGHIATLNGATFSVDGSTIVDADPDVRNARLVPGATDILAANGAVQAIDRVLLPADLDLPGDGIGGSIAAQLAGSGSGFDANPRDFDILNATLEAAGLTATLGDLSLDLTLFAPTDGAFLRLAQSFGFVGDDEAGAAGAVLGTLAAVSADGDPVPLLTEILTTHVVAGSLSARDIARAEAIEPLSGATITPFGRSLGDLDPSVADPRLIGGRADLPAANGVIQAIDGVLLPFDAAELDAGVPPLPTLAALVAQSGDGLDSFGQDFDILKAGLDATGLTAALDNRGAGLTLLAPTDDALIDLATALGFEGDSEAGALDAILRTLGELGGGDPLPLLTDILSYHVLEGVFSRQQLDAKGSTSTLFGEELLFEGRAIIDAEPGIEDAMFIPGGQNVPAANGALQAISGVLLPIDLALI